MKHTACYHLPGLFEFYELYRLFLPLFREHREYFYDWCEIGSIYGADVYKRQILHSAPLGKLLTHCVAFPV